MVEGLSVAASLIGDSPHNVRDRRAAKQQVLHAVQHRRFAVVDHVAPFYNVPTVERAAIRHAPLRVLLYAVNDSFTVNGAFPFCQHFEHTELQHAA
ncbi:MAG: hypothetical protein UEJ46_06410 [Eggerthellaceae bacterium]|nr:hypothetical protein [Eggerthellaceae bacterium]